MPRHFLIFLFLVAAYALPVVAQERTLLLIPLEMKRTYRPVAPDGPMMEKVELERVECRLADPCVREPSQDLVKQVRAAALSDGKLPRPKN